MDNTKKIELTIGREAGADAPRLAVKVGNEKSVFFGKPGSVPQSVSRNHCKVTVEGPKRTIEDITTNNFMYVNGSECKKRGNLGPGDTIELGPDRYRLDLDALLKTINSQTSWHIGHLEKIYNDYQQEKIDRQVQQAKLNAFSTLPGVLSMASIGLSFAFPNPAVRVVLIVIAAVMAGAFFVIRFRKASSDPIANLKREEEYRAKYICPNPSCGHTFGQTPYKDLLRNRVCPYCKSKLVE